MRHPVFHAYLGGHTLPRVNFNWNSSYLRNSRVSSNSAIELLWHGYIFSCTTNFLPGRTPLNQYHPKLSWLRHGIVSRATMPRWQIKIVNTTRARLPITNAARVIAVQRQLAHTHTHTFPFFPLWIINSNSIKVRGSILTSERTRTNNTPRKIYGFSPSPPSPLSFPCFSRTAALIKSEPARWKLSDNIQRGASTRLRESRKLQGKGDETLARRGNSVYSRESVSRGGREEMESKGWKRLQRFADEERERRRKRVVRRLAIPCLGFSNRRGRRTSQSAARNVHGGRQWRAIAYISLVSWCSRLLITRDSGLGTRVINGSGPRLPVPRDKVTSEPTAALYQSWFPEAAFTKEPFSSLLAPPSRGPRPRGGIMPDSYGTVQWRSIRLILSPPCRLFPNPSRGLRTQIISKCTRETRFQWTPWLDFPCFRNIPTRDLLSSLYSRYSVVQTLRA